MCRLNSSDWFGAVGFKLGGAEVPVQGRIQMSVGDDGSLGLSKGIASGGEFLQSVYRRATITGTGGYSFSVCIRPCSGTVSPVQHQA